MKNPFNYLQYATGDNFYDRREILSDLRSRFLSGASNVVLYGPRRYGKSSLVAQLVDELEKKGMPCIVFDVMKVPSIDLFATSYATKVYRKLAPVKFEFRKLASFFKSLRVKLTVGADEYISYSGGRDMDTSAYVDENNSIMMPISYVAHALGAAVTWTV